MIRKLILTAVCGLFVCASQGNCGSRMAIMARAQNQEAFSDAQEARNELSNMIRGKKHLQSEALNAAINKANDCVCKCIAENSQMARRCGLPQTQEQASFLKCFLESCKRVQTEERLTPLEKQQIEKLLSDAIRCYKGEVGPLAETAQTRLAQIPTQVSPEDIEPLVTIPRRSAQAKQGKATTSVNAAQQTSAKKRSSDDKGDAQLQVVKKKTHRTSGGHQSTPE